MTSTTSPVDFNAGPPAPAPWCGHCGRELADVRDCPCDSMTDDEHAEDLRALRQSVERVRALAEDLSTWLPLSGVSATDIAARILAALDGDTPKETT